MLKHNKYYVESGYPEMLQKLLKDPIIKSARVSQHSNPAAAAVKLLQDDDDEDEEEVVDLVPTSFEIETRAVEEVKRRCIELDYPLMEEYDFRHDDSPSLDIDLSPKTVHFALLAHQLT